MLSLLRFIVPYFSIVSNWKSRKFFRKSRTIFWEMDPQPHRFLQSIKLSKVTCKKSQGNTTIHRFLQSIQFHTKKKDGANTISLWLPKETVTALIMLYKKMKAVVCSPDGNTKFFNIVTEVLQRDILAPYIFIICLNYVLHMSINLIKENGFILKKQEADNILKKLWQTQTIEVI